MCYSNYYRSISYLFFVNIISYLLLQNFLLRYLP